LELLFYPNTLIGSLDLTVGSRDAFELVMSINSLFFGGSSRIFRSLFCAYRRKFWWN